MSLVVSFYLILISVDVASQGVLYLHSQRIVHRDIKVGISHFVNTETNS